MNTDKSKYRFNMGYVPLPKSVETFEPIDTETPTLKPSQSVEAPKEFTDEVSLNSTSKEELLEKFKESTADIEKDFNSNFKKVQTDADLTAVGEAAIQSMLAMCSMVYMMCLSLLGEDDSVFEQHDFRF